jgi:putative ABC transport system ATP-binding protein
MIRVTGLGKTYSGGAHPVIALQDVELAVPPGQFVAVMGPSGSGKSTFMNLLGCLDTPTSGSYVLDGVDVTQMGDADLAMVRNKKIGFVFQTFNLLPRMTALRNVELPMLYGGVAAPERRERALRALSMVGLAERVHHRPNQLSGGQVQRVAIARAVVSSPVILLADEPTGNLDSRSGREVMAIFQELNRKGTTIVLVTHERDIALHAGRILHFKDGCLVDEEINHQPTVAGETSHRNSEEVAAP